MPPSTERNRPQVLEALEVDYIDESEVLTIADEENHIDKSGFAVPFVCGCRDLGEALRRIAEGAAMLRTKGEAGTGNVVEAVRHARAVGRQIRQVSEWRCSSKPRVQLTCVPLCRRRRRRRLSAWTTWSCTPSPSPSRRH